MPKHSQCAMIALLAVSPGVRPFWQRGSSNDNVNKLLKDNNNKVVILIITIIPIKIIDDN